ncbi:hypothetical protein FRC17_008058 [Serendipita sp. 399]|nr:hypothetical protein FRC17_008058 [Serendipita sp. 399]
MSADAEDAKLQASIDAATKSAWKETRPSKFQSRLDKIENTIMNNDPTKSAYYAAGSAFVAENATAVNEVVSTVATAVNFKAIEDGIKTFAETSEVLMKALDAVASIHPVIGVVVLAFKGVVALELKRHSNDRKVIVIQLKMKDMVSVLLDLRGIKDPRHVAPDGKTIEGRMQDLMGRIAKDIDECGNVCETYGKKHVIVKIVKSISWEGKLSSYADTFDQYRKDILLAISIHTTLGVESANIKLDNVGENVRAIEDGMDMMNLLRMLDSPQERDLWKLVKAKGGAKACMENESVLKELVAMVGKKGGDQDAEVDSVKLGEIRKDLKEDIEDALRNNFGIFEKKLVLQQQDFAVKVENVVVRESDRTIATIMAGPHDRVKDKDLHKLWKEMGWKTSVKARHFVLAVHDYFVQKFAVKALEDRLETNTDDGREVAPSVISENPNNSEDDEWAMECITLSRITVMLEAFDDDGSGFISVTEVNEFTSSRPKDWSLLRWLAYWAEGWHYSIWDYRNKIGGMINDMYDLLDEKEMLAENRSLVDRYLSSPGFLSLQRLVKSVIPYTETNTAKLEEKIRPYVTQEEARMRASLEVVDWNIDGPDTLALITGPGRIERYIFPLIYLVLQRHSIILALSCSDIYLEDQLDVPAQTLSKIMDAVKLRMKTILTMLQQRSVDATALLKNVAFGMASIFKILNDPKLEREGEIERILTSDGDEDEVKKVEIQLLESVINFETYESIDQLEFDGDELAANDGSLRGRWTGHAFYDEDGHTDGLAQFHINEVDGDTFGGIGMDKIGRFSLEGEIVSRKDEQEQRIKFTLLYGTQEEPEDETPTLLLIYNGVFSTSSTTVKGTWGVPEEPNLGTFVMTQRPPFAYLFRYNERALAQNAALVRWKYALSTVRHQVRKRLWSWSYFQERMLTRRRYIDLRLRTEIANLYSVHPSNELTVEDKEELNRIEQGLSPADSGFYDSLATDIMRKICVH